MKTILVVGYPRSGNTWLSRLLGDALDCDVSSVGNRISFAERKGKRKDIVVIQDHLRVTDRGPFMKVGWCNPKEKGQNEIIYVERDPRDVAVSVMHYFERPSLIDTLYRMQTGEHPLRYGPWLDFVTGWLSVPRQVTMRMRYESMHRSAADALSRALSRLGEEPVKPISDIVTANSFSALRLKALERGEDQPHGQYANLKHLRRGHTADWKNWFDQRSGAFANRVFWPALQSLGYEQDENWWRALPPEGQAPQTRPAGARKT